MGAARKMEILAHRGFWTSPEEHNTEAAFRRALERGYGIETDVRDLNGELVISHDPPRQGALTLDAFFAIYRSYPSEPTLALNAKADGLYYSLKALLERHGVDNYFVFDMSVPDTLGYLQRGYRVFTRRSEYETGSLLDGKAAGLWLDSFTESQVPAGSVADHVGAGTAVAIVSPELHKKPYAAAWKAWRDALSDLSLRAPLMLCTDLPDAAREYFLESTL